MVCDKAVCERRCVQDGVRKVVCVCVKVVYKVVGERCGVCVCV